MAHTKRRGRRLVNVARCQRPSRDAPEQGRHSSPFIYSFVISFRFVSREAGAAFERVTVRRSCAARASIGGIPGEPRLRADIGPGASIPRPPRAFVTRSRVTMFGEKEKTKQQPLPERAAQLVSQASFLFLLGFLFSLFLLVFFFFFTRILWPTRCQARKTQKFHSKNKTKNKKTRPLAQSRHVPLIRAPCASRDSTF